MVDSELGTLSLILERDECEVVMARCCYHKSEHGKLRIGLDVARAAKELCPKPAILVFTGFARINPGKPLSIGAVYMTHKPVEVKEVASVLLRLIFNRRELADHK